MHGLTPGERLEVGVQREELRHVAGWPPTRARQVVGCDGLDERGKDRLGGGRVRVREMKKEEIVESE